MLSILVPTAASARTDGPAKPAPAPTSHAVTWDNYSLMIDGRRLVVWSGEFHPFRLPSPSLWRDILQKMKSSGYNAVSFYTDWGYHSAAQGVYDFTGVRDMDEFLRIAAQVGIYVIARPGPYINAEVDGGGFPGWLANTSGKARTNSATYLAYADEYLSQIDAIIARHQLTDGRGTVILYQIENEYASNVGSATGKDYMAHLYAKVRSDGITVPIFHNDKGRNGYWVPGGFTTSDSNYLYGFDGYPAGTCSTSGNPGTPGAPPDWGYYGTVGASASPTTPGLLAEFGGGWFDPWGDKLWGGAGYPCMRNRQSASMERQYYLTNIANGIKIQNVYMTYGGTSWGWLPAPIVYTSYDYGAAIDEARNLTGKVPAMKEMGYFLQSVPDIAKIDKAAAVTPSDSAIKTYHLANPDTGTNFYFVRSDSTSTDSSFTLPITTPDGSYTLPLQLKGVDMKALLANYALDSQHLVYSTSELMTHAADLNGQDTALFYTRDGQNGETVLRYSSEPTVTTLSGTAPTTGYDAATGDLKLSYTGDGLSEVRISGGGTRRPLLLLLASESVAQTFWRLDTPNGPVIARGPELLRTASVAGRRVELTGDTKAAAPLEVWAPRGGEVTWNGSRVRTVSTAAGSLLASSDLAGAPSVTLPALTNWKYSAETPEAQPGFDDSTWTVADHTTSTSTTKVPAGQNVLFADDYGFHHGDIWYRGVYSAAADAAAVSLTFQSGQVGLMQGWLDGRYLGSYQIPTPTSSQSTTQDWSGTANWAIPDDLRTSGKHTLAVLVRPMSHDEDGGANDAQKTARGLVSATLTGSAAPISWKIQGDQGGENITDTVRGPLNNGGLYGERAGWYLPGYPDRGWQDVTLPRTAGTAGVSWYRTSFKLHVPKGVDSSIGLTISDDAAKAYRALIFVNGWNLGQYINNVGPQHTFVLPNGVLNPDGRNTVAIAVTASDDNVGLGSVSLTDLGTVAGGTGLTLVDSPRYRAPSLTGTPVRATAGTEFTGQVATVTIPSDARGTSFTTTIDWGDGTRGPGTINADGAVTGAHTYLKPGHYRLGVKTADAYGPALSTTRTEAAVAS